MKERRISAPLTIFALSLTISLILTALRLTSTAAPHVERQPLESLSGLNSTKATGSGVPSAASVVQSPGTTTRISAALHSSPVMFIENVSQFDPRARFQIPTMGTTATSLSANLQSDPQTNPFLRSVNSASTTAVVPSLRLVAQDGGIWHTYTNGDEVNTLAGEGDYVWAGTSGGVVRWNRNNGSYIKYTIDDGLVSNVVRAIVVDEQGHKWFGTEGGVNEFDGSTWRTYTTADGLVHNPVRSVAIDDMGHKWFGTWGGGVSEFDGSAWRTYTMTDGLANDYVMAIAVDEQGHKWFGTKGGVSEFDGVAWTTYTTADGLANDYVMAIAVDEVGHKWFGTKGGVSEFDGVTWMTYTTADGLRSNYVMSIAIDEAGHKWFGTGGSCVSEFAGVLWTSHTTADGLVRNWVYAIAVDEAGHKWFGTTYGVSEFDAVMWYTHRTRDDVAGNYVMAIAVDQIGHKWFGSMRGVSEFDGRTWHNHYPQGRGFSSMAVDSAGHIWVGVADSYSWGGVREFDGHEWHAYSLPSWPVTDIAVDSEGRKWFATGGGVSVFDGSTWYNYTSDDGLAYHRVYAVAIDEAGHKWFGTNDGLSKFDGTTWTTYTTADGLVSNSIRSLAIDAAGHVWVGTHLDGVSEFDGAVWRTYTTDNGLADNRVRAIAVDERGHKWFGTCGDGWLGTDGGGVSEFDGVTWRTYTTADGLVDNCVLSIATDEAGHIWFGTSNGVSEFIPGGEPTELTEAIQSMATSTNTRLDQVLAEANEIAQDGDYFAVQKTEHEIDLMADAIIDSAGILADGFDGVKKVKDLTKMEFPGVIGRGWGHILDLKAGHQAVRDAFRDALQQEVTGTNARRAAKEFFNGAHIYYAADMLDSAAEDLLGDGMVKYGWKVGLQSDLALQNQVYPAQQRLVNIYKQDVTDTRDETIGNMPWLTPEEQQAYIEDLTQRDKANIVMAFTLERRALPLHLARADRESHSENWIANFLAKYLIKGLVYLYADGPGVLAVNVGSAFWDLYQNSRQLNKDIQMVNLAVEGMGGSLSAEKRIYLNVVHGMDNIVQGIEPQITRGSVSAIANKSEGEYKLFGSWFWCERSSYSEVNISNSTSYDTVYQVIADYGKTGFMGMSYQPLVGEGARAIPGSASDTVRVHYKQDDEGASPDEGSNIEMGLLGSTDTGTYHVTHQGTTWNPTRVTASGVLQVTTQAQAEALTIPYPIRTRMVVDEDTLTYTPHIWVDNPFDPTVMVTLTQLLPTDVQVINANGGSVVGNSLLWQMTINPQATVEITHVVRYLGDAGQVVHYPEPQLEMTDLGATAYVTFTGETETFIAQPPLSAVGTPPAEIAQGESTTIPITVINRLADQAASGTARLSLIDFEAETEVYSDIQAVYVPAGGSQVVELWLDTANVSAGDYLLTAIVESNGGQEEVFAEYLRVTLRLYLPLILRNR